MGVLADLVPRAQQALASGGCDAPGTEGATWNYPFIDVTDDNGDPIDLTAVTGTCKILDPGLVTVIATMVFTGHIDGSFELTLDEAATVGLAAGAVGPRNCRWYLKLNDGTDTVQVWEPFDSTFLIYPAGA